MGSTGRATAAMSGRSKKAVLLLTRTQVER